MKVKNIKFYSKEGKSENFVSELLMHLTGNIDGEDRTIIMSITGKIDLKKISKLTSDLNMPGSKELKNIDQKNLTYGTDKICYWNWISGTYFI